MQKLTRRSMIFVLVSARIADAQTGVVWRKNSSYRALAPESIITPEEIMKAGLGSYTDEEIKLLFEKLPSPKPWHIRGQIALVALKGYVLVPVPPAAISKSTELWLAIRLDAIPDSFNETWEEQLKRTNEHQRVPTAEEVTWWVQVLWATRHKLPFHHIYIRTSSPSLDGGHVCLGGNAAGILKIKHCPDAMRSVDIGIAPAVKRP